MRKCDFNKVPEQFCFNSHYNQILIFTIGFEEISISFNSFSQKGNLQFCRYWFEYVFTR